MKITKYDDFWNNFGGFKCDGVGYKKKLKLKIVHEFSHKIIENLGYHNDKSFAVRCCFEQNNKWYHNFKKYSLCFICGKKPKFRHHIIGIAKGGSNNRKNFVSLCKICHNKAHRKLINY